MTIPVSAASALGGKSNLPTRDVFYPHVLAQRLRHQYAAISLLIIFQNRQPGAPNGQAAAVQGVHEIGFLAAFRTPANIRTPRLESLKVRARGNFAIELLPRQPNFEVISLGCGKSQVGGA